MHHQHDNVDALESADARAVGTPIAVVGLSCMFPGASCLREYWRNLREGIDAIREVPESHWSTSDYYDPDPSAPDRTYGRRGGFLDPVDFDPMEFGISPRDLETTDTTQLLGLMVAKRALEDAGYGEGARSFDRERTSVMLGVTGALELVVPLGARLGHPIWRRALLDAGIAPGLAEEVVERIGEAYPPWQESAFPGLLGNVAAGRIANRLDLQGTNCVVDAACASSLSAMHLAMLELSTGRCDMALTGGIDTFNDIFMFMCFSKTPALSPSGDARPFDENGDGTALGEGLGVLALKRLADAERDGDRIYAVVRGMGTSSDGKGLAVYAPSHEGQARALRAAYRDAGCDPTTVELLEAHGTGTRVGDAVEAKGLTSVFGAARASAPGSEGPWCALGSAKSMIGHTKAAAGAAGMIKAVLALHHRVLPPTLKVEQPNEAIAPGTTPFYVNTLKRPWLPSPDHPRRAGVSSFGFGGTNFHCVLEEYPKAATIDWDGEVQLLPLAAAEPVELLTELKELESSGAEAVGSEGKGWSKVRLLASEARSRFDPTAAHRLVLVLERGGPSLHQLVRQARERVETLGDQPRGDAVSSVPSGIYLGRGPAGGVAALFPGQGAQYVGMLRDLSCQFPALLDSLSLADAAWRRAGGHGRLSDRIYPQPAFDSATEEAHEAALRATEVAQPALGALSLGALALLRDFGFAPDALIGHSYGELVALCAAGRLSAEELFDLSIVRGRAMAAGKGDRGSMLALASTREEAEQLIAEHDLRVVLANRNAPRQHVLSGPSEEIERAARFAEQAGLSPRRLAVAAAFHSPLVADATHILAASLEASPLPAGDRPVWANTTGAPYPEDAEAARALLSGQLAAPVEFQRSIEALWNEGIRLFVEVGPGSRLSGLVRQTLEGRDATVVSLDDSYGRRHGLHDLARTLAKLAAAGVAVDLSRWDPASADQSLARERAFTVELTGANYRDPESRQRTERTSRKPSAAPVRGEAVDDDIPKGDALPEASAGIGLEAEAAPLADPHLRALLELQRQTVEAHTRFLDSQDRLARIVAQRMTGEEGPWSLASGTVGSVASAVPAVSPGASPVSPGAVSTSAGPPSSLPPVSVPPGPVSASSGGSRSVRVPEAVSPAAPVELSGADSTAALVLAVVSEKTGYPVEMLELEMGLDADLGIDSIKRVEIFSALEEALPDAPRLDPDRLALLQTLAEVVAELAGDSPPRSTRAQAPMPQSAIESVATDATRCAGADLVLAVVSEKTGYPAEMLELEMGLDADLGIDSIKRVEILSALEEALPGAPRLDPDRLGELRTLADVVAALGMATPEAASAVAVGGDVEQAAPMDSSATSAIVLAVVSEKTGYPVEMLELEMGLDADLGIDSIKRVEILSALEEATSRPSLDPDRLAELQTLGDVARAFAVEPVPAGPQPAAARRSVSASVGSSTADSSAAPTRLGDAEVTVKLAEVLLRIVAEKTGYPVEMLELEMGLDADLGIDSIKRVEILSALEEALPEMPRVEAEEVSELRTLKDVVDHLTRGAAAPSLREPDDSVPTAAGGATGSDGVIAFRPSLRDLVLEGSGSGGGTLLPTGARIALASMSESPTDRWRDGLAQALGERGYIVDLVDLEAEAVPGGDPSALILLAPSTLSARPLDDWLAAAFRRLRRSAPRLQAAAHSDEKPSGALFAAITRVDGQLGLGASKGQPEGADRTVMAVAGLVRTAALELGEVRCRMLDAAPGLEPEQVVPVLLAEGPVELGVDERGVRTSQLEPVPDVAWPGAFSSEDLFVVTGGARGVTAEVAAELARRGVGRLVLIGRSPAGSGEPEWLRSLEDEAQIKRALLEHKAQRLAPAELEKLYRLVMGEREIAKTLERLQQLGARVFYRSVDVRDRLALDRVIGEIRRELGPVTGLVHGAGVLADRRIVDKSDSDWARVYDTKVVGLRNLLGALGRDSLRALVLFSSSTGRFGRRGQIDYSVANAMLGMVARDEAARRPECRVLSVDWGPWAGGMVTPALERVFRDEGIVPIPLETGARFLIDRLGAGRETELVALGAGSSLPAGRLQRGLPVAMPLMSPDKGSLPSQDRSASSHSEPVAEPDAPSTSPVDGGRVAVRREVSVASHPFLRSHVLSGKAVLPVSMMIEWMAHGALHDFPGLRFLGFEEMRVLKGLRLNGETVELVVRVGSARESEACRFVPVSLASVTEVPGNGGPQETVLARAEVVLGEELPQAPQALPLPAVEPYAVAPADCYDGLLLFHGEALQGVAAIEGASPAGIVAVSRAAPPPRQWMIDPLRGHWLAEPLMIDVAFQSMILWSQQQRGVGSLPVYARSYRQFVRRFPKEPLRVVARVVEEEERRAVADLEWVASDGTVVARLEGYECVIDASLNRAFQLNRLAGAASGDAAGS